LVRNAVFVRVARAAEPEGRNAGRDEEGVHAGVAAGAALLLVAHVPAVELESEALSRAKDRADAAMDRREGLRAASIAFDRSRSDPAVYIWKNPAIAVGRQNEAHPVVPEGAASRGRLELGRRGAQHSLDPDPPIQEAAAAEAEGGAVLERLFRVVEFAARLERDHGALLDGERPRRHPAEKKKEREEGREQGAGVRLMHVESPPGSPTVGGKESREFGCFSPLCQDSDILWGHLDQDPSVRSKSLSE